MQFVCMSCNKKYQEMQECDCGGVLVPDLAGPLKALTEEEKSKVSPDVVRLDSLADVIEGLTKDLKDTLISKGIVKEAGAKADSDKLDYSVVPAEWFAWLAEVGSYGAKVYGRDSWKEVPNFMNRYYSALMRHLVAWRKGENKDIVSGFSHLAHCAWNCLALLTMEDINGK